MFGDGYFEGFNRTRMAFVQSIQVTTIFDPSPDTKPTYCPYNEAEQPLFVMLVNGKIVDYLNSMQRDP